MHCSKLDKDGDGSFRMGDLMGVIEDQQENVKDDSCSTILGLIIPESWKTLCLLLHGTISGHRVPPIDTGHYLQLRIPESSKTLRSSTLCVS